MNFLPGSSVITMDNYMQREKVGAPVSTRYRISHPSRAADAAESRRAPDDSAR